MLHGSAVSKIELIVFLGIALPGYIVIEIENKVFNIASIVYHRPGYSIVRCVTVIRVDDIFKCHTLLFFAQVTVQHI